MNSRGQAALEYLMTYGWALVIIVVVAGILFFIMSSPTSGVTCTSSDPSKMPVQSFNIPATTGATGTIKVINGTAGSITLTGGSFSTDTTNEFSAVTFTPTPGAATTVTGGGTIQATTTLDSTSNALDSNASITLQYNDQFGYTKTLKVTCQGKPQ
jgi:uncharacterized protein (UPF0333 family)